MPHTRLALFLAATVAPALVVALLPSCPVAVALAAGLGLLAAALRRFDPAPVAEPPARWVALVECGGLPAAIACADADRAVALALDHGGQVRPLLSAEEVRS